MLEFKNKFSFDHYKYRYKHYRWWVLVGYVFYVFLKKEN